VAVALLTDTGGKPPTVLSLARHLGLANTTFRRHFPDITAELSHQRTASAPTNPAAVTAFQRLHGDNARLRATNQNLAEHLDLAMANIQRLTLENQRLRHELEAAVNVTHLSRRRHPAPPTVRPQ
jgi:hypothetical protein